MFKGPGSLIGISGDQFQFLPKNDVGIAGCTGSAAEQTCICRKAELIFGRIVAAHIIDNPPAVIIKSAVNEEILSA